MIKIITVIGARPQFIKAATLSRFINSYNNNIKEVIIHTGQHYDNNMSNIFFSELNIPKPKYNLGIGGVSHGEMVGRMIEKLEKIIIKEEPEWIVVYGDTNSTLAAAIVSSKLNIKLAHIEAGLRSYNMNMPEEINRILTDRISNLLFCPTQKSISNLKLEGYDNSKWQKIIYSGDIMYEGALHYRKLIKKPISLTHYNLEKFVLATIHREESTNNISVLKEIISALNNINKSIPVILPIHPRTLKVLNKNNISCNFIIIKPVSYLEINWLISNSDLVITDSGGLQKEAFFYEKKCITIRKETEWIELLENDNNIITGPDKKKILDAFSKNGHFIKLKTKIFGNGKTSKIIIDNILNYSK